MNNVCQIVKSARKSHYHTNTNTLSPHTNTLPLLIRKIARPTRARQLGIGTVPSIIVKACYGLYTHPKSASKGKGGLFKPITQSPSGHGMTFAPDRFFGHKSQHNYIMRSIRRFRPIISYYVTISQFLPYWQQKTIRYFSYIIVIVGLLT